MLGLKVNHVRKRGPWCIVVSFASDVYLMTLVKDMGLPVWSQLTILMITLLNLQIQEYDIKWRRYLSDVFVVENEDVIYYQAPLHRISFYLCEKSRYEVCMRCDPFLLSLISVVKSCPALAHSALIYQGLGLPWRWWLYILWLTPFGLMVHI